MKKRNQNAAKPTEVSGAETSKPKEGLVIAGPIKKCPSCGEDLPEKIAFCLYCMKDLRNATEHNRNNGENSSKRKPAKMLIWAAAVAALVVVVGITSTVTAAILLRQGGLNHFRSRPAITTPMNQPEPTPTPETVQAPEQILTPESTPATEPPPAPTPSPTPETIPAQTADETHIATPESAPQETPPQSQLSDSNSRRRPVNPAISLERAIEIGYEELARRGHTGTFRRDSGMDWEPRYGGWVWEIEFRIEGTRRLAVEMYINVDTGSVVKFEWDD